MTTDTERERHDPEMPEEEWVPEDDAVIGKAFRWSLLVGGLLVVVVLATLWSLREQPEAEAEIVRDPVTVPQILEQNTAGMPSVDFTDITRWSGIDFVHNSGAYGAKLLPETMGGGVAFLDFDGDGDEDLLFVNSTDWPERRVAGSTTMGLYRNDGTGRFDNVTAGSGLDASFYGQGIAVADYDNDGRTDVFVTALGPNRLFRNTGDRFVEVTRKAGVAGESEAWSTSAGFFDYDNDGDLDLFVCNYVLWSREIDMKLAFTLNGTDRAYGPPKSYQGVHSYLYRNEGDGTFTDVSEEMGVRVDNPATGKPMGKALAVTFADGDLDGFLDVFVSNDTVQNFVFRNVKGRAFEEIGGISGVGFDNQGTATGAMGIDAADVTGQDRLGITIANFSNETTSFYLQQTDPWQFVDVSNALGIGSPSRLKLSFGLFFFDYDLDGRLDLLQANGHLEDEINEIQPSQHYRQPPQLFWNCGSDGGTCFAAVAEEQLGALSIPIVGRGAAFADIDADGDLDVVLTQTGGRPLLVRNELERDRHWLRVKLVGRRSNRDAIGARLELRAAGRAQKRTVMPTRSYLSQVERTVTFGLGDSGSVDGLVVRWPSGTVQEVPVTAVDTTLVVTEEG